MEDQINIEQLSLNDKEEVLTEEIIMMNREKLKKRTQEKMNSKKNNKQNPQNTQIKALQNNPLFKNLNLNLVNDIDIKKVIEDLSSKMTTDSKQKKNIKKQVNKLIEKIKEQNSSNS